MPTNLTDSQNINQEKSDWFVVLPAQLQTVADRTSGVFTSKHRDGVILTVVTANEAGTFSATPKVQTLDAFGTTVTLWTAAAAIDAAGTFTYALTPTTFTNSSFTEVAGLNLPRNWFFLLDYGATPATDKADTKVSACYI